jgi:hypothetical protein
MVSDIGGILPPFGSPWSTQTGTHRELQRTHLRTNNQSGLLYFLRPWIRNSVLLSHVIGLKVKPDNRA